MYKCVQFVITNMSKLFLSNTVSVILRDPGAVSGGRRKSKRVRKKFERRKVKNEEKTLLLILDFSSPKFFSRPFRLFPVPTNCPWVYKDELASTHVNINIPTISYLDCHTLDFHPHIQKDNLYNKLMNISPEVLCMFVLVSRIFEISCLRG